MTKMTPSDGKRTSPLLCLYADDQAYWVTWSWFACKWDAASSHV